MRCLLYATGAGVGSGAGAGGQRRAAAQPAARPRQAGALLLDVQRPARALPDPQGPAAARARRMSRRCDGVSLAIAAGRTLALVGESGCGKTTVGKAILQLLRRHAHDRAASALLDGADLFDAATATRCAPRGATIQIIFQDPFASLNPRMRVVDILEEGMAALRPEHATRRSAARASTGCSTQVGLRRETLERYPHEFSGGQRQRIAIARALAVRAAADRLRRADLARSTCRCRRRSSTC